MRFSRKRERLTIERTADAPRGFLTDSGAVAINGGPEPDRIDRQLEARNSGLIGNAVAGWPYDGSAHHIPHLRTPRVPTTVVPFGRTIDAGATIPAVYVGAPERT